jgi:hypothetical protein
MSDLDAKLELFKTLAAEAYPQRVVTRTFQDVSQRDQRDLKKGIYTVLFQGIPRMGKLGGSPVTVKVLLLGQFQVEEDALGNVVEAGELAMVEEINELLRLAANRYPDVPRIEGVEMATSSQLEHPFGWVAAVLEMSWTKKCTT